MSHKIDFPFPPVFYGDVEGLEDCIIEAAMAVGDELGQHVEPDALINVGLLLVVMGMHAKDTSDPIAHLNEMKSCAYTSLENLKAYAAAEKAKERTN